MWSTEKRKYNGLVIPRISPDGMVWIRSSMFINFYKLKLILSQLYIKKIETELYLRMNSVTYQKKNISVHFYILFYACPLRLCWFHFRNK